MTEQEWLHSADLRKMLQFLGESANQRRLRLFALACCRQVESFLTHKRSRLALEMLEQILEGGLGPEHLPQAGELAQSAYFQTRTNDSAGRAVMMACYTNALSAACDAAAAASKTLEQFAREATRQQGMQPTRVPGSLSPGAIIRRTHCGWLRDVFGPPNRPTPDVSAWLGGPVLTMARTIYQEQSFGDLPILADALEEAGCDHAGILAHFRHAADHVRGCWALDLVLGRS
jgi:hypothetical protein